MKNKLKLFIIGSSLISVVMLMGSCGESAKDGEGEKVIDSIDTILQDSSNGSENVFMIGGQIFSIPSPVQTAFLIFLVWELLHRLLCIDLQKHAWLQL